MCIVWRTEQIKQNVQLGVWTIESNRAWIECKELTLGHGRVVQVVSYQTGLKSRAEEAISWTTGWTNKMTITMATPTKWTMFFLYNITQMQRVPM